jgi:hypothetical protein
MHSLLAIIVELNWTVRAFAKIPAVISESLKVRFVCAPVPFVWVGVDDGAAGAA